MQPKSYSSPSLPSTSSFSSWKKWSLHFRYSTVPGLTGHPTPAGEIYLNAAKDILLIKKNAYNQIYDLCEAQKGHITLGFTPGRGIAMFTSVYPKFHNICPRIEVEPIERSVRDQHPLLLSGELDLGFMTLTRSQQKSGIIYETLASEEMVLAVPTKLVTALDMRNGDLALLREEPFVLTQKTLPSGRSLILLKMPDSPLMFCSRLQITMRSSP